MRTLLVRQSILEALSMSHGYALPDQSLRRHVSALVRPPVAEDEWEGTMAWLEKQAHITRVPSDLDESLVQWAITERGRTLLKTL